MWLDCNAQTDIAAALGVSQADVSRSIQERKTADLNNPPESRQHFDVWQFATADKDSGSQSGGHPRGVNEWVDDLHMFG